MQLTHASVTGLGASPVAKPDVSMKTCWILALVFAGAFVAIVPPLSLWPVAFIAPLPLAMLALQANSMRVIVLTVCVTQLLMWLWLLRWIADVTAVGYPALAMYLSAHMLLLTWLIRRVARSRIGAKIPMTLLLPLLWTAAEYFRGEVAFDGYPWYMVGQPLIHWLALAQASDVFGMYFMSFLAVMPAGALIDCIRLRRFQRVIPVVAACGVLLVLVIYGHWRLDQQQADTVDLRVLAIQTNLPQSNKVAWSPQQQAEDLPRFIALTRQAVAEHSDRDAAADAERAVDLIVWPETMLPSLGFEPTTLANIDRFGESFAYLTRWAREVERFSRVELKIPMLIGTKAWIGTSIAVDDEGYATLEREREYNSAYLIQGEPPYQRYDKAVLTPFGETMPYISRWKWLEERLLALGARGMRFNLDANPRIALLRLPLNRNGARDVVMGTPICFEDTVASLCRRMAYADGRKQLDVFVNISNDGWFGESAADRILHAHIARFRCIENRVPMVRCVNTGVSMHIDSLGRVVGMADKVNQPGWVRADIRFDARSTIFSRIGHAFPIACVFLTLGLVLASVFRSRRSVDSREPS